MLDLLLELKKLRRRPAILLMPLASVVMPVISLAYFSTHRYVLTDSMVYKQAIFSFNIFLILPALLGIFSAMGSYGERANNVLNQLWIVPVGRGAFLFSKWFITFVFALAFMLLSELFTLGFGLLFRLLTFDPPLIGFFLWKGVEAAVVLALSNLPILALALLSKGYLLPCCAAIVYAFCGFIFASTSPYIVPSASAIFYIEHNLPDVYFPQPYNPFAIFLCFAVWILLSVLSAVKGMKRG